MIPHHARAGKPRAAPAMRATGRRAARGIAVVLVEYDDAILDFLVRTRWLDESEADVSKERVGDAIGAMLREASRGV